MAEQLIGRMVKILAKGSDKGQRGRVVRPNPFNPIEVPESCLLVAVLDERYGQHYSVFQRDDLELVEGGFST